MPCSRQAAATREIHNYSIHNTNTPLLHKHTSKSLHLSEKEQWVYGFIILLTMDNAELWTQRTTELNLINKGSVDDITDLTVLMLRRLAFLALEAYTKALRTARTAKL